MLRKLWLPAIAAGIFVLASCKKESSSGDQTGGDSTVSASDKIKDSVLLYSKDIYLWYTQIPSSFNARSYSDPNKIMEAIRTYSKEPGFSNPVDKWSFAIKQAEWDDVSSGISGDFGMSVFFNAEGDLRVKSVEKQSPAGKAGIRRGWRITQINGNTNMTTSNTDFIVNNVFYSSSSSFKFTKPDGSSTDMSLSAATYQENPIYLDTVYSTGGRTAGYLVFNSFLGDTTAVYNEFQRIFNRFSSAGVQDVIIDLRYNGGGYVSVQEKLADYLVKSSASGQLMMKEQFNDRYTQFNETINFSKLGSLNAERIFFIVSDNTASASELLINNLKPFADVKLVGPSDTYGKPVGYFPIPVGDWYIFPVSFRSVNNKGEGGYFDGIQVNSQSPDGLDKDWGDIKESCLANVLNYIGTGAFKPLSTQPLSKTENVHQGNEVLSAPSFKGAVARPRSIK
jgi:carboxyl-terminal processing protease